MKLNTDLKALLSVNMISECQDLHSVCFCCHVYFEIWFIVVNSKGKNSHLATFGTVLISFVDYFLRIMAVLSLKAGSLL